jgi:endonuclease YncB( thermonuclease family)
VTTQPFVYQVADVLRIVDGDTFWLYCSVGFHETVLVDVRLLGFDCPEKNSGDDYEKQQAAKATAVTVEFLTTAPGVLWVRTEKDPDSFGRWLGEVWREADDGTRTLLGDVLRAEGLASIWPTRWHEEFEPA